MARKRRPRSKAARRDAVVRRTATIVNQRGLHARAAARVAGLAERFATEITVSANGISVSALSIMGLMLLAAGPGTEVEISASGRAADEAVSALVALIEAGFDED
jgi:phosphocarrier protein